MQQYYAPDYQVKIEGATLAADVSNAVIDLTFDNNLDTADMFSLNLNNADLRFTDSALFDVGKNVEIHMGYVGNLHPMMLGEITAVNPTFPAGGAPTLSITGYDKSHRLRHNSPEPQTFRYVGDSRIAARIAAENLLIPIVDPSPMPTQKCVQQTGSDWALLKELAVRNFFHVYVYWDKLYFRFPQPSLEKVVLEWGKNLSSFSPRLSTSGQAGIQVIRGYNYELAQKIVTVLPTLALGSDLDDIIERLGSSFIEQLMSLGRFVVRDKPITDYLHATTLAKSILLQLLQGLYEGTGSCIGIPELRAGEMVEIRGIGKRFSGKYTLSKVKHTINANGYQTQFEVRQGDGSTLLQSLRKKLQEKAPPNRQKKLEGVFTAIVENNDDPQGLGRVQISFPHLSDDNVSCWVRVASAMAGGDEKKSWGSYFVPEVEDEVLVVFEQGDINRPVVIGSVFNGTARPPGIKPDANANNAKKKMITTRSGMQILFDESPKKENLVIQDKAGSIFKMDSKTGDILIEAKGNVTIKSGSGGKIDLNP